MKSLVIIVKKVLTKKHLGIIVLNVKVIGVVLICVQIVLKINSHHLMHMISQALKPLLMNNVGPFFFTFLLLLFLIFN